MKKDYLWQKLGPMIQQGLQDEKVFEIMLNPDLTLWFNYQHIGNMLVGHVDANAANTFVHALAQYEMKFLNNQTPYLDAVLPFSGERINVTIPPVTENISFNIRKKAKQVFTLPDYVNAGVLTAVQANILKRAIRDRKNILISGSPASGKTTLTNAVLHSLAELAPDGHRVLILEQVPELQCQVKNLKAMVVSEHASMNTLLWIAMRSSPDRIVVGEVRDGSALDLLKAWNTGCPGGVATIHANNAKAAVQRVLDLACEVVVNPPYSLAAEALDLIVQIEARAKHPAGRVISEIVAVRGFNHLDKTFYFKNLDTEESYEKLYSTEK